MKHLKSSWMIEMEEQNLQYGRDCEEAKKDDW